MKKIIIDEAFWQLFPDAEINVLVLDGIDNQRPKDDAEFRQLLREANKNAEEHLTADSYTQNDFVQEWRQAYQQFKTKKKARSSIEALMKRVDQGHEFDPINPLVDFYNWASISYAVPMGGEDIDTIEGDLHLGMAKGGEPFFPLGADEDAPALEGEICYFDEAGAVCRCLNWREAERTMLTEGTTRALIITEAINSQQIERSRKAMEALSEKLSEYFQVTPKAYRLTQDQPEATLEA